MLKRYKSIIVKPVNGMGGKGIVKLNYDNLMLTMEKDNEAKQEISLNSLVESLASSHSYIIQKWIDIRDKDNHVFDIRALVQKNAAHKWELTGMAVRRGQAFSITSNLKGGGAVFEVSPFLTKTFGAERAKHLTKQLSRIALYIPSYLEKIYNKQLFELGIDLAVDRHGQVWIIEVNNKPGKTIFQQLNDPILDEKSKRLPVLYAHSLLKRKTGR